MTRNEPKINSRKSLISHFRKSTISPVTPTAFLMMRICRTLWKALRTDLAKGVKEAVQEDGFLGIFTGGLKASAGGITAAILSGLIASLIFKAKDKS